MQHVLIRPTVGLEPGLDDSFFGKQYRPTNGCACGTSGRLSVCRLRRPMYCS